MLTTETKRKRLLTLVATGVGLIAFEATTHFLGMIIPWRSVALWVGGVFAFVGLYALVIWAERKGFSDAEFGPTTQNEIAEEEKKEQDQRKARQERH